MVSRRHGALAGDNPWGADTLEWATSSPPPHYNFLYLPTVNGRHPLWTQTPMQPVVTGMRTDVREVLVTTAVDAAPDHRHYLDGPAISPLLLALATGVTFIAGIFTPWGVLVGAGLAAVALAIWFWPVGPPIAGTAREAA
jgi:cytochrome c oxidase subunit 1